MNGMSRRSLALACEVAGVVAIALPSSVFGGGAAKTPGVSASSIRADVIGTFSGPSGQIISDVDHAAFQTWADSVNAHGGINGRKIDLTFIDDKGTDEGRTLACKTVTTNNTFFALVVPGSYQEGNCLNAAKIPMVTTSVEGYNPHWKYVRVLQLRTDGGQTMATWVRKTYGASAKIGVIYSGGSIPSDAISKQIANGFRAEAKLIGVDVADVETSADGQSDYTAIIQRFKDAGVTVILSLDNSLYPVSGGLAKLHYSATLTTVAGWCIDEYIKPAAAGFKGIQCLRNFGDETTAGFKSFLALVTKYEPSLLKVTTTTTAEPYALAVQLGQALRLAGKNLTADAVMAQLSKFKKVPANILPPTDWSKVVLTRALYPAKCCFDDGTLQNTAPPKVSFYP